MIRLVAYKITFRPSPLAGLLMPLNPAELDHFVQKTRVRMLNASSDTISLEYVGQDKRLEPGGVAWIDMRFCTRYGSRFMLGKIKRTTPQLAVGDPDIEPDPEYVIRPHDIFGRR